jgi:hypothetical protein
LTVGRETENSSSRSVMVYSPVSCIRFSSRCCFGDIFCCRPLSMPWALATAIPSRVRIRIRSTSNSANVAKMLKNIFPIGVVRIVGLAPERQRDAAPDVVDADAFRGNAERKVRLALSREVLFVG